MDNTTVMVIAMLVAPLYGKLLYLSRKVGCIEGKVTVILKLLNEEGGKS